MFRDHSTNEEDPVRLIALLFAVATVAGCAPRPVMISAPCGARTKAEIIATLTPVLLAEGMEIKLANESLGLLQAETRPDFSIWSGATSVCKWSISVKSGTTPDAAGASAPVTIQAFASSYASSSNAFGATTATTETPYDDHAHPSHKWYWNVRNALAEYCGATLIFTRDGEPVEQPAPDR